MLWKEETSWVLCDHIGTVGGLGYFAVGTALNRYHCICHFCCTLCNNYQCHAGCASYLLPCQQCLAGLHHVCPPLDLYSCCCALQLHDALCCCCAASAAHDHVLYMMSLVSWASGSIWSNTPWPVDSPWPVDRVTVHGRLTEWQSMTSWQSMAECQSLAGWQFMAAWHSASSWSWAYDGVIVTMGSVTNIEMKKDTSFHSMIPLPLQYYSVWSSSFSRGSFLLG